MPDEIRIRPMAHVDKPYVFSVTHKMVLASIERRRYEPETLQYRDRFMDRDVVRDLVDHIVTEATVTVAILAEAVDAQHRPEIQAFVVEEPREGAIEFAHLRGHYDEMSSVRLASNIMKRLISERPELVMRRHASAPTMAALTSAFGRVVVRPRSV